MTAWRGMLAALLASLGVFLASSAGAADLKAGQHFRVIDPPLVAEQGRIEVTEFFWYGCPHCFDFEPVLAAWVRKLPPDVSFRRVPAIFPNNKWAPGARLYYTLEAMNLVEKLHGDVFAAIHVERRRFDDERVIFEWAATKGIDVRQFKETWSSFGVHTRVQQARELTQAAGLTGVPAVVVQGRYQAITSGNYEELTAIIDQLIYVVRAENGRKRTSGGG